MRSTEGRAPALLSSVSSYVPASHSFDLHAAPEGDVLFYLPCRVLRLRVVPSSIFVRLAADDHVVITRRPLPGADRVRLALAQVLAPHRLRREVVIALDHNRVVALRQHCAVP